MLWNQTKDQKALANATLLMAILFNIFFIFVQSTD